MYRLFTTVLLASVLFWGCGGADDQKGDGIEGEGNTLAAEETNPFEGEVSGSPCPPTDKLTSFTLYDKKVQLPLPEGFSSGDAVFYQEFHLNPDTLMDMIVKFKKCNGDIGCKHGVYIRCEAEDEEKGAVYASVYSPAKSDDIFRISAIPLNVVRGDSTGKQYADLVYFKGPLFKGKEPVKNPTRVILSMGSDLHYHEQKEE